MTLQQALEAVSDLPMGIQRILSDFDLSGELERVKFVADKDRRRVQGFIPAVLTRATELSMQVGFRLGKIEASGHVSADIVLQQVSEEASKFYHETTAVIKMWDKQFRELMGGDIFGDPTKAEREITRIWAKRNALPADYQTILGVSDKTPTEYPNDFVEKWL